MLTAAAGGVRRAVSPSYTLLTVRVVYTTPSGNAGLGPGLGPGQAIG